MPKLLSLLKTAPAPGPHSEVAPSLDPLADDDDALIGKCLNDTYVIEGVLGEGGMGRVYRAHHTRMGQKRFAIKVLRPEFTRNSEVLARFRREAEVAACISHPNVVGVYDVDTTPEGFAYIVCEYLEGLDLAGQLERSKRIDVAMAVHIVVQVCRALSAAHARGVVHRDIKPHNVFLLAEASGAVSPRPSVKVLDFGLSRFTDSTETQLTRTGVIMGTPAYMAPEQAKAQEADHRADVYGVGCILYAALTGRAPFEAEHVQGIVLAVMTEEPRPPRSINPAIPENLELVIQRAMAKNVAERYQSMDELRAALEPFALDDAFEVASDKRARLPSAQRGSRAMLEAEARAVSTARPRLLALAAGTLVLLVAGVSSTVPSVELLTGPLRFTNTELLLVLLSILGTLLTPALIFVRRFRKTVWANHAKVLGLLNAAQAGLMASVFAYGLCALLVRFLDDVAGRFGISPLLGHGQGAGWAGWNLLFFLIALSAGLLSGFRQRLLLRNPSGVVRVLVRPALLVATALVPLALLYSGLLWRQALAAPATAGSKNPPAALAAGVSEPAPAAPSPVARSDSAERAEGTPAPAPALPIEKAPAAELAAAVAQGVDGLLPLAERYPRDPAVLRPLMLAFASRATTLADAMAVAKRLLQVAPEETRDGDLRILVKKAAASPGDASRLAFELLSEHMGSTGPDLLYELYLSSSKAGKRAQELLESEGVKRRASPALAVAYELRKASSCAARVPLLERAAELGDERSIAVLSPLSAGSKRGCGRYKRQPCQPACAAEAARYTQTVARITARLSQLR